MRELTEIERTAKDAAYRQLVNPPINAARGFTAGFIAGLEYARELPIESLIRFEIKQEVVEWLTQEWVSEPEMAVELIEGLMGMMIAHKCISVSASHLGTAEPDADLLAALRGLVQYLEPQFQHIHITQEPPAMKAARAAIARVGGE